MEAETVGHLEDSLSSKPLCQQKQDLGVETATAVHIANHSREHLLRSVDNKAELGNIIQPELKYYGISLTLPGAPWWRHKDKLWHLYPEVFLYPLPLRTDIEGSPVWWLTLAILATWEAEIGRITVRGQPRQIVQEAHLQNNQSKMDWRRGSSSRAPAL
jgi:hypothetical protein